MKKQLALSILMLIYMENTCRSQTYIDTIFTTNMDTIPCRITLVNSMNIFYMYGKNKSADISKKLVDYYVLNSKDADVLTAPPKSNPVTLNSSSDTLYRKGQNDAIKYYDDYVEAGTGTLVISLLSPLVGLIPAIACSSTQPKDKNLNFHNSELIKNPDYYNGYVNSAKKIKRQKVWMNWEVAFTFNILAVIIIVSNHSGTQ